MCLFDLHTMEEEEAVVSVKNSEASVCKVGFCGPNHLYCLTHEGGCVVWENSEVCVGGCCQHPLSFPPFPLFTSHSLPLSSPLSPTLSLSSPLSPTLSPFLPQLSPTLLPFLPHSPPLSPLFPCSSL